MRNFITLITVLFCYLSVTHSQNQDISDEDLKNTVSLELQLQADVPAHLIEVSVTDGVVTLDGYTTNLRAKDRAVKTVTSVKGVRGVINRLSITTSTKSDQEVEDDLEEAFIRNAATDLFEIDVDVTNGNAILAGTVDSWQEKKLVEYVAKGVKGVVGIENQINVDYNEERSDYDIKKDIEGLLANDVRIQGENLNVQVHDGNVVITGEVSSAAKKAHAEILSWVAGVKNVNTENVEVDIWTDRENRKNLADYSRTDREIEAAIKEVLQQDPRVNAFDIQPESENGRVILTGEVNNLHAKFAAERDAKNVIGVYTVKNFIAVSPDDVPKNEILEGRIETALEDDPYLERFEINITANNGNVFLTGLVDNYFEKYHAEDLISSINGVVMVDNEISVQDEITAGEDEQFYYDPDWNTAYPLPYTHLPEVTGERADWEIKQDIENQIWWSPNVDESEITVQVEDGIATLTGTVNTWEQKQNATKNAVQGGAEEVNNKLEVRSKPEINRNQ